MYVQKKLGTTRENVKQEKFIPKFDDLKALKELGHGEFGTVFLVGLKDSFYALKCIDKIKIKKSKL